MAKEGGVAGRRAAVRAAAVTVVVSALVLWYTFGSIPEGRTDFGKAQYGLFMVVNALGIGVLVLFEAGLVYIAVRNLPRYREEGRPEPSARTRNVWLAAWILLPMLVLAIVAAPTMSMMVFLDPEAEADFEVEVTGMMWEWVFVYPDGEESVAVMRVEENQSVRLVVSSADVIHSLYVPDLSLKIDAVPGTTNTITFRPTEPGSYEGACTEYCGIGHPRMNFTIEVFAAGSQDQPFGAA